MAKRIPVRDGGVVVAFAVVDDADAPLIERRSWRLHMCGYAVASTRRGQLLMHRVILGLSRGDGKITDHINRDKLDNRRENLRLVTSSGNAQNRERPGGRYSQYRGVTRKGNRWRALATIAGKQVYLGVFEDEAEAAAVAASWRAEHMPYSPEAQAKAAA